MAEDAVKIDNLGALRKMFHPRKQYDLPEYGIRVSVEGIFIQVTDEMCVQIDADNSPEVLQVHIEDILQDPNAIRSARVSTGRDTDAVNDKAQGLINYLYRDHHETPYEGGVVFKMKVRTPINYAEPFFQLPWAHNEASGRYKTYDEAQGFSIPAGLSSEAQDIYRIAHDDSIAVYRKFVAEGMAKEQARFALPYAFFTEFYWTVSLRHLLELMTLEKNDLAPGAFWETRDRILGKIVEEWAPWSYQAFKDNPRSIPTHYPNAGLDRQNLGEAVKDIWRGALHWANVGYVGRVVLVDTWGSDELMKLGAWTGPNPRRGFGHAGMTLFAEVPIFVYRQWVRHRYSVWAAFPTDFDTVVERGNFYTPVSFREQTGKVGSYVYAPVDRARNDIFRNALNGLTARSCDAYNKLRHRDISPERAAMVLPYSFRVQRLWSANVESLMNFFSLRVDQHAQEETRMYAETIYPWFKAYFPWANEMFLKYLNWGRSPLFGENS